MNKNLNLVDILKDCPKGTKLYSIIHGDVEFEKIKENETCPIKYKFKDKRCNYIYAASVAIDGRYSIDHNGECTLFPSKDQRDWDKFKVEPEMVDGEFYYCFYGNNQKENSFIFIYKKHMTYKTKCYAALSMLSSVLFRDDLITNNNKNITELRKATEEEKQQLLDAIKIRNYEWDSDKKELVKIEQKFDISTLQPFDKVLVRNGNDNWTCTLFSNIITTDNKKHFFKCINSMWTQCVPYNNETEYLVGTNEESPKKYVTWEE